MTEIEIFDSKSELCTQMAGQLLELIEKSPRKEFNLAITGGGLGIALLESIREHPSRDLVNWKTVHVFWGDERFVPGKHSDRNDLQAQQALLSHLDTNNHPFPASDQVSLQQARIEYEAILRDHFAASDIVFDLVLLGIGPDGHIASLFPAQIHPQSDAIVAVENSPKPPAERLSLNYWVLNQARRVWFLAAGPEKQVAVNAILAGGSELPGALVSGREETKFFLTADVI